MHPRRRLDFVEFRVARSTAPRVRSDFAIMQSFDDRKPEIAYPGPWNYRIIGEDEARMRAAVVEVVGVVEYSLVLSNQSSGGRYRSLELELIVVDEAHRLAVFDALSKHEDIRFVF